MTPISQKPACKPNDQPIEISEKPLLNNRVKKIASITRMGHVPQRPDKPNQDSHFIIKNFVQQKDMYLLGVLDGHGQFGHNVSQFVKKRLPSKFINHFCS